MRTPKLVSCTVTLPLSTYRALRREAREAGVSMTHCITMGIVQGTDCSLPMRRASDLRRAERACARLFSAEARAAAN